jgi:hypothetical protein
MEDWEFNFEWQRVRHLVKDTLGTGVVPDMNGLLFLIGMQELGRIQAVFSKEEKQDLMHLAVCRLLEYDHIYEFVGRDEDGWPHYKKTGNIPVTGEAAQERFLQERAILYFKEWETQHNDLEIATEDA